jgi:hypothetical protein
MGVFRAMAFGVFLTASTMATAQSIGPFANTYERNVFCAAAGLFMAQSSAGGANFDAINYWLTATTAEGTRRGYSADQNREAVEKKTADIMSTAANGQEGNIRATYRQSCNTN